MWLFQKYILFQVKQVKFRETASLTICLLQL